MGDIDNIGHNMAVHKKGIDMKTYEFNGRKVYIRPTIRTPWKGGSKGLPYTTKPYTVRYVDDDSLAIDGEYCMVETAIEAIESHNKRANNGTSVQ